MALFRVKLACEEMVRSDTGSEAQPVGCGGSDEGCFIGYDIIGVDEVDKIPGWDPLQKGRLFLFFDAVPSHMRDFVLFAGAKTNHLARK